MNIWDTGSPDKVFSLYVTLLRKSLPIVNYYCNLLSTAPKLYTITDREQEFLSGIEICKEYKNILLGYAIIVFTDHKNNTYNGSKENTSDSVLCWLFLLEEYGLTFEYLLGKNLVTYLADASYLLDIDSLKIQEKVLTL
jgi:hypothetical protein